MRTLFWKVFLILAMSQVCLILVVAVVLKFEYDQRFSEFNLSQNFQPLADFVVKQYENGVDVTGGDFRSRENSLAIFSYAADELIYGRRWGSPENRVSWNFQSEGGQDYQVFVQVPPRSRWLPEVLNTYPMIGAFATVLMFSWLLTFLLTGPIRRLKTHVKSLAEGELDHRLESRLTRRRDEIGALATALDEMSERIQKLLESKQRLLYDVSHELRAPLARMQVAAEMVRAHAEERGEDPTLHERVSYEINSLNAIITQLLQLARNESEGVQLDTSGLREPLREVVEDMQFSWSERDIRLSCTGGLRLYRYQSGILRSAVKNVVENSLKYSPADSPVEILLEESEGQQLIRIRDHGPGIPDDRLESMFQPFTRMQSESIEGFGLGLSIAKRAVETLGGSIMLGNHPEGGLIAEIRLKLQLADDYT